MFIELERMNLMKYFLTSSASIPESYKVNSANGFIENLKNALGKTTIKTLYISSDPDAYELTDDFSSYTKLGFEEVGLHFDPFIIFDHRQTVNVQEYLNEVDLVILSGGHVPTQNQFFQEIQLAEKIQTFKGVVIGISAGTMNAAETVYAHPELEGESINPDYQRFLIGLGLTTKQVIPHYNFLKHEYLDGKHVIKEIATEDSMNQEFYIFPDGTYIYGHGGMEELYGEAYLLKDKIFKKINTNDQIISL